MNRRRPNEIPSQKSAFLALILMALIATAGGAMHAIYRTGQIKAEREMSDVRKRMTEHRLDIQMIEVRTERLLDRYEIRAQLNDSSLVELNHTVVQRVQPLSASDPSIPVASRP